MSQRNGYSVVRNGSAPAAPKERPQYFARLILDDSEESVYVLNEFKKARVPFEVSRWDPQMAWDIYYPKAPAAIIARGDQAGDVREGVTAISILVLNPLIELSAGDAADHACAGDA